MKKLTIMTIMALFAIALMAESSFAMTSVLINGVNVNTCLIRAGQNNISYLARASGVVTVTLNSAYPNNNLKAGQNIVITASDSGFNGTFQILPGCSQTVFQYNQAGADVAQKSATGNAGGDFVLLSSWEAGREGNLPVTNAIEQAECYADWNGGLSDNVRISGATCDATHYMRIYAPESERHHGAWDPNKFMITSSDHTAYGAFQINESYFRIEYIQIVDTYNTDTTQTMTLNVSNNNNILINGCIITGFPLANHYGLYLHSGYIACYIINTISYNTYTGFYVSSFSTGYSNNVYFYNCTAAKCNYGYYFNGSVSLKDVFTVKNCLAAGNNVDFYNTCSPLTILTGQNNCSADPSAATCVTGGIGQGNVTVKFVSPSADFRLAPLPANASLIGQTTPFTNAGCPVPLCFDVDGSYRVHTMWDIGADEHATEFKCAIRAADKTNPAPDYDNLGQPLLISTWAAALNGIDLPSNSTKVFSGAITVGSIKKDDTVTLQDTPGGTFTGKVVHAGPSQILVTNISPTPSYSGTYYSFSPGDQWVASGGTFQISDIGDAAIAVAECYDDWAGGLNDNITLAYGSSNLITDGKHRIIIRSAPGNQYTMPVVAAPNHKGFYLRPISGTYGIKLGDDTAVTAYNISINGIEIDLGGLSTSNSYGIGHGATAGYFKNIEIANCLIHGSTAQNASGVALNCGSNATGNISVYNNMIYDMAGSNDCGISLSASAAGVILPLYNNTVYNVPTSGKGISASGSTVRAINNLAIGYTTCFSGTFEPSSDYNCSSDNNAVPGTHSLSLNNQAAGGIIFVGATAPIDLHLKPSIGATNPCLGASAKNLMYDSLCPVNTDFEGDPWPATGNWDIGADAMTIFTWTGGANNVNWSDIGNWNPARLPDSSSNVVIPANKSYYPTISSPSSPKVKSLTINGGSLTIDTGAGIEVISDLNNNAALSLNSGASLTVDGSLNNAYILNASASGASNISVGGNFNSTATFTSGASTLNMTGSGSNNTITLSQAPLNNISFNNASGTFVFADSMVAVNGSWTQSAGTVIAPTISLTVGGGWTVSPSSTFNSKDINGNAYGTLILGPSSPVSFLSQGGSSYNDLEISGTGTVNMQSSINVHNLNLTGSAVTGTATINVGRDLNIASSWNSAGSSTPITLNGGGSEQIIRNTDTGNLTLPAINIGSTSPPVSANVSMASPCIFNSTVTIISESTLNLTNDVTFLGAVTIKSNCTLSCIAPGKTVRFAPPGTNPSCWVMAGGKLTLKGGAGDDENLLNLTSTTTSLWTFTMQGTYTIDYTHVSYSDAHLSSYTIFPTNSTYGDTDTNINWTFSGKSKWVGNSIAWDVGGNWQSGQVPGPTAAVWIPVVTGGKKYPTIATATQVGSLQIDSGASLTLNANLSLSSDLTCGGANPITTNSNTVIFDGASAQAINGTMTLYNMTVNSGATVNIGSGAAITVSNSFANSGTTSMTGGTLTTPQVVNNSGGTINHSGGTIKVTSSYQGAGTYTGTAAGTLQLAGASVKSTVSASQFPSIEVLTGAASSIDAASTQNFNINGNFTIDSGATFTTNDKPMSVAGNWTNNGAFTPGAGTVTFNATASQTIGGGSSITTFYNVVNSSAGLNHSSGTIKITSSYQGDGIYAGTSGGTLQLSGASVKATSPASQFPGVEVLSYATPSSIDAASTQPFSINGNFQIDSGAVFQTHNKTMSVAGNWTNNAGSSGFTSGTGSVKFVVPSGSTATLTSGGCTFFGLTNTSDGTVNLGDNLTISTVFTNNKGTFDIADKDFTSVTSVGPYLSGGTVRIGPTAAGGNGFTAKDMTISSGATLSCYGTSANPSKIKVSGNWNSSAGAFSTDSGKVSTVEFNGTGTQSVNNGATNHFYNLTYSGSGTLQPACAGGTLYIDGTLLLPAAAAGTFDNQTNKNNIVANTVAAVTGTTAKLSMGDGATWKMVGTGTFDTRYFLAPDANHNNFTAGLSTLEINGNCTLQMDDPSQYGHALYNMTVDNGASVTINSSPKNSWAAHFRGIMDIYGTVNINAQWNLQGPLQLHSTAIVQNANGNTDCIGLDDYCPGLTVFEQGAVITPNLDLGAISNSGSRILAPGQYGGMVDIYHDGANSDEKVILTVGNYYFNGGLRFYVPSNGGANGVLHLQATNSNITVTTLTFQYAAANVTPVKIENIGNTNWTITGDIVISGNSSNSIRWTKGSGAITLGGSTSNSINLTPLNAGDTLEPVIVDAGSGHTKTLQSSINTTSLTINSGILARGSNNVAVAGPLKLIGGSITGTGPGTLSAPYIAEIDSAFGGVTGGITLPNGAVVASSGPALFFPPSASAYIFPAGSTLTVGGGTVHFNGASDLNRVILRSGTEGTPWNLINNGGIVQGTYVDVHDSRGSGTAPISATNSVSYNTTGWAITGALKTPMTVTLPSNYAGDTKTDTVTFNTSNTIPAGGKVMVVFPQGTGGSPGPWTFNSGGNTTIAANVSGMNGALTTAINGQTVTVSNSTQLEPPGPYSFTLTNIRNPNSPGDTGPFLINTADASVNSTPIDSGTAPGLTIVGPSLSDWSLNLDQGTITLDFNVPVDVEHYFTPGAITLQDAQTAGSQCPLTNSTTISSNSQQIIINLSPADLAAIKDNPAVAKSQGSSWLIMDPSFTRGTNGNPVGQIQNGYAMQALTYINSTKPALSSWALDMQTHRMTLNFSEAVKGGSGVTIGGLTLQNAAGTVTKTLTTSTASGADSAQILITLSTADFNAIVDTPGLCDNAADSYLAIAADAIKNVTGNGITAVTIGPLPAPSYTANAVAPTNFQLTTSSNTSINAGQTISGVNIKAYDAGYRALGYNGSEQLTFTGASDSPNPTLPLTLHPKVNGLDLNSAPPQIPVNFTKGVASVNIMLFRAESAGIAASDTASTPNVVTQPQNALAVTVGPAIETRLLFVPGTIPATGAVNTLLNPQPKVIISDDYGNKTADSGMIKLYAWLDQGGSEQGSVVLSNSTLLATNGEADFSGVMYSYAETIYLQATASGLTSVFSDFPIVFSTSASTTVDISPGFPASFDIVPTNDNIDKKFAVLKFRINDQGGDSMPTRVDRITVTVAGPQASHDIAWAELVGAKVGGTGNYTTHQAAFTNTIGDSVITFGITPNGNSAGDLDVVPDSTIIEYTMNIYMRNSKLSAPDQQTYAFTGNSVDVDSAITSSTIGANSHPTATGKIKVEYDHLEIVNSPDGLTSGTLTAGTSYPLTIRTTDANKNIAAKINHSSAISLMFTGLNYIGTNYPKIGSTYTCFDTYPNPQTLLVNFTDGQSTRQVTAYKAEVGSIGCYDTGNHINAYYPFTATVNALEGTTFQKVSGDGQIGKTSKALPAQLVVTSTDIYGNMVPGASVTFAVTPPANGAFVSPTAATTGSDGLARTSLTLGSVDGQYTVSASAGGAPVTFTATGRLPDHIAQMGGNNQTGTVNKPLANPFMAQLVNAGNSPIPNETISFNISQAPAGAAGQAISTPSGTPPGTTDSNGQASTTLTLGNKAGDYVVSASYPGVSAVNFTGTGTSDLPYQAAFTANPASVVVAQPSDMFVITVEDSNGNASKVSDDTTFSLNPPQSSTQAFYSDSGCTNANKIIQIKVSSGQSASPAFYYMGTQAGPVSITATRISGDTLTQPSTPPISLTVLPAAIHHFVISGDTSGILAGASRTIQITAKDINNNTLTNWTGNLGVQFSGAHSSPSGKPPTAVNLSGTDIPFGSTCQLLFTAGVANTSLKFYAAEVGNIAATAEPTHTPAPFTISVGNAPADHTKFANALPASHLTAGGTLNFGTTLNVVDAYDNICDGAISPGAAYSPAGVVPVDWTLTPPGTSGGSPDGHTNNFPANTLTFSGGRSTANPTAVIYGATPSSGAVITAHITALNNTIADVASTPIYVDAGAINNLSFMQPPSTTGITNQPLAQQPWIAVADQYGNPCSNINAQITLAASITSDKFTPAVNGVLTSSLPAHNNTLDLTNGVAKFTGLAYSYPEQIYLQASSSVGGYSTILPNVITFTAANDLSITPAAAGNTVSSMANSYAQRTAVFGFTIADAGQDGLDGLIKKITITRSASDQLDWTQYMNTTAYLADAAGNQISGQVLSDSIVFDGGGVTLVTVPNGTSKTFLVKIMLKTSLPPNADGQIFGFTLDAANNVKVDNRGSVWPVTSPAPIIQSCAVAVDATALWITGDASMPAGGTNTITIKAIDANKNIDKDYTGPRNLTFSGADPIGANPPNYPTCNGANFGDPSTVTFDKGAGSAAMKLYKSQVATIQATDNIISAEGVNALVVSVTSGDPAKLLWNVQPVGYAALNSPMPEFVVGLTDTYGNTASNDGVPVTVTPGGGTVGTGATATANTVAGLAHFSNFFVSAAPAVMTLSATSGSFTPSVPSNNIIVDAAYTVVINAKDSVSSAQLTQTQLTIIYASGPHNGEVFSPTPIRQNSPFGTNGELKLPYGDYTLLLEKDLYVTQTAPVTAGSQADGADGHYNNQITWDVLVTSVEESQADYNVNAGFVYDETAKNLAIKTWLTRRGKIVTNVPGNYLGSAYIYISDNDPNDRFNPIIISPPSSADLGNVLTATFTTTIQDALSSSNSLGIALVPGKTYFATCKIGYGGTVQDNPRVTYQNTTTFTITATQSLSADVSAIQAAIGTPAAGQTISSQLDTVAGQVAAVQTAVQTQGATIGAKVDAVAAAVGVADTGGNITSPPQTLASQVSAIVSSTQPGGTLEKTITSTAEKGVLSEILTRDSIIRNGDSIAIRYRTQPGLSPTLSLYDAAGKSVPNYSMTPMKDISGDYTKNGSGIYEATITSGENWATDTNLDYTVVCQEPTLQSKDSMILTVAPIFTVGANVEQTIDNIGYAVSKVYSRAGTIQNLIGTKSDPSSANTIMGQVNGVNNTINGLNLVTVSTDAREARANAEKASTDISTIKDQVNDVQAQMAALRQFNSEIDDLKATLRKISQNTASGAAIGPVSGGVSPGEAMLLAQGQAAPVKGKGGPGSAADVAKEHDIKEISNKVSELTALTQVVTKLIESNSNKPVVEGWFERE